MKQLVGISNNLFYNEKKEPMIETIFMIHAPKWEMINGQTIKKEKLVECRVFNKVETIKKMFIGYINEIEKQVEDANAQST